MKCTYTAMKLFAAIDGRRGGGVCFYIRSCINFSVRYDLKFDELENLCISINKPRSTPFLIAT